MPKWYVAYVFLAAFDIVTVSISLYLNHQIMELYTSSVDVNREWAARLDQLDELRKLAGQVNAPGNDVFDTRNVNGESAAMSAHLQRFQRKLAAIRRDLAMSVAQSEREPLRGGLQVVDAAVDEMSDEALQIFSHLEQKRPEEAATHMAAMDRKYARVHAAFADLADLIRTSQQARFDQQRAAALRMQQFEFLIATFIVGMVAGASVYGHRLYRQIRADGREKEQFLHDLQEKEERYRLLVEGVKDHANVMLEPCGHIASWNTGAERLYGYQGPDILGQHYSRLYTAEEAEHGRFARLLERVEATGTMEAEGWHARNGGARFWGEDVVTALRDAEGRLRGFSKITRDITERKRAQAALEDAHAKLQKLDRLRTQFFADISHELRTPLTVIQGEAEVTLRGRDKPTTEYKAALAHIVQLTNEIGKLVNDLLFLARSESGTLSLAMQRVSLQDIMTECLQEAGILASGKRVSLRFHGHKKPLIVRGDPQRIKQLVMLIVDNAVKYTRPGGNAEAFLGREGSWAKIAISDTGVGIPEHDLPHVFERFYRVKRPGSDIQDGAGLGLPIAKWITEAHGGTICIDSPAGNGTTVIILLPMTHAGEV